MCLICMHGRVFLLIVVIELNLLFHKLFTYSFALILKLFKPCLISNCGEFAIIKIGII